MEMEWHEPVIANSASAGCENSPLDTATGFDTIYATYAPLLRKIAIRKFGIPRNEVDALIHDVFTTYLANPDAVRELRPYLIGGICNAARQYRRTDIAERELFCDEHPCRAELDQSMVDEVTRSLTLGALLARVGEKCRETLREFYLEGFSASAIAAARGTSATYIFRLLQFCRMRARAICASLDDNS